MKLGLSLAGGGIKGAAHIGAIKALQEEGVQIDYISGTSSGSIVASLYACGYSTSEMYNIFKKYAKICGIKIPPANLRKSHPFCGALPRSDCRTIQPLHTADGYCHRMPRDVPGKSPPEKTYTTFCSPAPLPGSIPSCSCRTDPPTAPDSVPLPASCRPHSPYADWAPIFLPDRTSAFPEE